MQRPKHQLQDNKLTQKLPTGKFFGYDQETRIIWINDFAYLLKSHWLINKARATFSDQIPREGDI